MDIYSAIALIVRVILGLALFKEGKRALKPHTRNASTIFMLVATLAIALGFYVYFVTLLLLFYLGIRLWQHWRGFAITSDTMAFFLTLLLFLKGPGEFSIDKLLGNI